MKFVSGISLVLLASFFLEPIGHTVDGGASGVGRGETFVVLPDDTVIVADPYMDRAPRVSVSRDLSGSPYVMPKEVHVELERILSILRRYSGLAHTYPNLEKYLFEEGSDLYSRDKRPFYLVVDQLPKGCDAMPLKELPPGAISHVYMCTEGLTTFISAELFKKRTSVREWAKALFHERLHALTPAASHDLIAELLSGVGLSLEIYDRQVKGERPILGDNQIAQIRSMIEASSILDVINLYNIDYYRTFSRVPERKGVPLKSELIQFHFDQHFITRNGGGLIHRKAKIADDLYAGIGTFLGSTATIGSSVTLLDVSFSGALGAGSYVAYSNIPFHSKIGERTRIERSQLPSKEAELGDDCRLIDSQFTPLVKLKLGSGVEILNTQIRARTITLGNGATILNSRIHFAQRSKADPSVSEEDRTILKMGPSAKIENSRIGPFDSQSRGGYFVVGFSYAENPYQPTLELGEATELLNWNETEGSLLSSHKGALIVLFPIYLKDRDASLKLPAHTVFDLEGKPLCGDGSAHPGIEIIGRNILDAKQGTLEGLRKLICPESKKGSKPRKESGEGK